MGPSFIYFTWYFFQNYGHFYEIRTPDRHTDIAKQYPKPLTLIWSWTPLYTSFCGVSVGIRSHSIKSALVRSGTMVTILLWDLHIVSSLYLWITKSVYNSVFVSFYSHHSFLPRAIILPPGSSTLKTKTWSPYQTLMLDEETWCPLDVPVHPKGVRLCYIQNSVQTNGSLPHQTSLYHVFMDLTEAWQCAEALSYRNRTGSSPVLPEHQKHTVVWNVFVCCGINTTLSGLVQNLKNYTRPLSLLQ